MTKLTIKQEKFCQSYIELGNAAEAYRQSYDAENMKPVTIKRKAAELLENGNIAAHVRALREKNQERHFVTVDSLTAELEEARLLAKQTEQPAPMISASMGKAKLHGLAADKHELAGKDGGPIETKDVSDEDAARRIAFLFASAIKGISNGN